MSTITFRGNLADDPELRFTPAGVPVVELVVIENRRTKNDAGEWVDATANRYVVKAWRGMAENIAATLGKGTNVSVTGSIRTEKWEDKDTGGNRSAQHIEAEDVAVSLKHQTATVTKSTRANTDDA